MLETEPRENVFDNMVDGVNDRLEYFNQELLIAELGFAGWVCDNF